jgi:hypothetical protein
MHNRYERIEPGYENALHPAMAGVYECGRRECMDQMTLLGKRLICDDCGAKYYDLNRNPATCPKCGCTRIRKKALKTAIAAPMNINVDDEEDLNKDDIDLEPLDDLEIDSDSDDDDLDED